MADHPPLHLRHLDRFFIGGAWVTPSSSATIVVTDSATEERLFAIAEAQQPDLDRAVEAARQAFDSGPWPRMTHAERAEYLRAMAAALRNRAGEVADIWPREAGVLSSVAKGAAEGTASTFEYYASLAETFPFEEEARPTAGGDFGLVVREAVGVVGAIVPWNAAMGTFAYKVAPALLAGCTEVLKSSPEAPAEGYILAEIAEEVGLPAGVLNVVTANREVSELLVRDRRVDKITFTGSTAVGRRIAAICGERIARCTLELGGKSAAIILDDFDIETAAQTLAEAGSRLSGQVCSLLTRIIVPRGRHDELVDGLSAAFSQVRVGDPFDSETQMGPLASEQQRDRVLGYIGKGRQEGATLATGGHRPPHLERGWFVEPTVFGNVDNGSTIAQEEIFGPVLSVIPVEDEHDAVRVANDTIYGLNASVFTGDPERARSIAGQLRSGTVGHNAFRTDFGIAFGGFKQSGIGREGGIEGLHPFLETKTVILEGRPSAHASSVS